MRIFKEVFILIVFVFVGQLMSASFVFASTTDGTIDSTYKYAWGENIGWVNFGASNGDVHVTDLKLSGQALSENSGWIYLGDIKNDGEGKLSGYAWGENVGWIKFNPTNGGVSINSEGYFTGQALSENVGWIVFDGDKKVRTDWRPRSTRPACNNGIDDDGDGKIDYPSDTGCSSLDDNDEVNRSGVSGSITNFFSSIFNPVPSTPTVVENKPSVIDNIFNIIKETPSKLVDNIIPNFLKPKPVVVPTIEVPIEDLVPRVSPLAFKGKWNLMPTESIREFVLAPLPVDIRNLAQKFPELGKTLEEVGISKITDITKLQMVKLGLPGLTEAGLPATNAGAGNLASIQGIPVSSLTDIAKGKLPSEIVFTKTGGGLVDFNIALSITNEGEAQQKINTISGKPLQLVVKPDSPVKSVKGYIVFKSRDKQTASIDFPANSLLASAIFADPIFAKTQEAPVQIEEKLVLQEFEYTDPDKDGIYTAEIQAPVVAGEYEVITVLEFTDSKLGRKEIRLTTVVDPEGYVYEKNGDKETRIPGSIVSIFWLNPQTKQYELWNAEKYQQENPQTTNMSGTYSFLVPKGLYYLNVETPGYLTHTSKPFEVKEGSGVHTNIELQTKSGWLKNVDWKTVLLVVVLILLVLNFYRDKIRYKFFSKKS